MPKNELDMVQDAHHQVFDALRGLSPELQARVLESVVTLLNIRSPRSIPLQPEAFSTLDSRTEVGDFTRDRDLTPKAFLFSKKPRSDVERVACLAYYLTHFRDTPYFKTVDISKLNTEAAQQKLSNPSYTVNNAVQAGFIVSATGGEKQLSAAGEIFVQELPDYETAKAAIASARKKRNSKKRSSTQIPTKKPTTS